MTEIAGFPARSRVQPVLTASGIDRALSTTPTRHLSVAEARLAAAIGAGVASRRRARGWDQSDLARRVGVGGSAVSRWEAGTRLPSLGHLLALARAFGCRVGDLLPDEALTR